MPWSAHPDKDGEFSRHLVETDLPNMIGVSSGAKFKTPADIFSGSTKDKEAAVSFLNGHPSKKEAARLVEWINTGR